MLVRTGLDTDHRGLLSRAQGGDISAFEKLVEKYRDDVYGFGQRMTRSETAALEIAQEGFLSAYLHLGQFQTEKDFSAWVHQTAASHALRQLRLVGIAPVYDEKLTASELCERSSAQCSGEVWSRHIEEKVLNADLRRVLEDATDSLPESHREVLLLKDVAGLSCEQIAKISGGSIPAIKERLQEARLSMWATIERFC